MSSLRQDSLTGRWVIIAAQRQGRPNEFRDRLLKMPDQLPSSNRCPFCPGQENQTPPEVLATGRTPDMVSDSPGWRVRVVPNRYPAVKAEPGTPHTPNSSLLRPQGPAQGVHEVVVCCPGHQDSLGTVPKDHLTEILSVVRHRMKALEQENPSARYVLVFGNHGPEAGATLAHAHLQIISTPIVPVLVVDKAENFIRYKAVNNSCLLCDSLAEEEAADTRLIAANNNWVAAAPWASRFPCEMRLMPRRHSPSMVHCSDAELADLADLMRLCLSGLGNHAPGAGYNIVIHNAPLAAADRGGYGNDRLDSMGLFQDHFHWHLEILPRLTRQAGFEAGTGFAINSLPPEEAAVILRPERR